MKQKDIKDQLEEQRLKIESLENALHRERFRFNAVYENVETSLSKIHKANELRDGEITELRASIAELRKKIRNPFDALYRIWKESEWRI